MIQNSTRKISSLVSLW